MAAARLRDAHDGSDAALAAANAHAGPGGAFAYAFAGSPGRGLRYAVAGDGPMLIFVHGFPSFWYCWQRQLEALRHDYRVVAIDALGAGGSAKPRDDGAYAIPLLAEDIDRVARTVGGDAPFVLIGHDWGAALAFAFAQARPERLLGVAGLGAPPFNQFLDLVADVPEQQARSAYMPVFHGLTFGRIVAERLAPKLASNAYAGLAERDRIAPGELELFLAAVGDPAAMWGGTAWYRANIPPFEAISANARWPQDDPPLAVPSLLIWGEADETFMGDFPGFFTSRHRGSEVLRLPGVGHWSMLEAPEAVSAALGGFAARVTGGTA